MPYEDVRRRTAHYPPSKYPSIYKFGNTIYRVPTVRLCAAVAPTEDTVCQRYRNTSKAARRSALTQPLRAELEARLRSDGPSRPGLRDIPHTVGFATSFPSDVQCPP